MDEVSFISVLNHDEFADEFKGVPVLSVWSVLCAIRPCS